MGNLGIGPINLFKYKNLNRTHYPTKEARSLAYFFVYG